ncbi:ABC transporter substrate-binding protein [Brevibacillus sp. H7]|uniref:ABC transporter substrate-binding protein n=1 Tax=Brevibacillus sp. H7 TaxID=3349138 RepID=UPI003802509A
MRRNIARFALIGLLTLSLALAGCGNTQQTQSTSEQSGKAQQTEEKNTQNGLKQLVIGRGGDSVGLDPIARNDTESFKVTKNIFETLVNYEEENTNVVPALAESWDVSADGLTYTFKLRQGVKFHDGTDFNAEAVQFNFYRWMDKDHPLHNKDGLQFYSGMFSGFKGDKDHVIKSVDVVDPYTVKFSLYRPLAPFIQNLGMACFAIASPKALKEMGPEKFAQNPVGTGPFKFVEWKRNDTIVLEKNQDYWNKGYPKLDKLVFKVIPENTARLTALAAGEIDLMDGLNPDDTQVVTDNAELQLIFRPSMNVGYLGFHVEKGPLKHPKVRQAIAHVINKPALIEAFYGGLGEPAVNPMPPSLWGWNGNIKDREYNLEKAKQLLAEAGYPNGFSIQFLAMPVPRLYMTEGVKIAESIQQELNKVGIKAEIVTMEWAAYLDTIKRGEQEMYLLGWTGENGDPDNFLNTLLGHGKRTRWENQEFQKILLQAQSATAKEEREKLYLKAQEIIFNEVPMIPLAHSTPALAAKKIVSNFKPHPTGSESLEKVDIQ